MLWNGKNLKLFTEGAINSVMIFILNRYATLYFIVCVDQNDNELIQLELIHHFCVTMDKYFGNVC